MKTFNDEIKECGLFYLGYYDNLYIRLTGTKFGIEIPFEDVKKFTNIFPEIKWEDGEFINKVKGKYIRVNVTDDYQKVCSLEHIVKDIKYIVGEDFKR